MNSPIKINNKIKGNRTKNQAIPGAPALHIRFNTHVQNKTYIILIKKIIVVLVTSQV
jgi:hypothetical protein